MNHTDVTVPPSYYEYTENEEKKIFTYKFIRFMPLSQCPQDVIDIINPTKQQVLNDNDSTKLIGKVFMSIINLILLNKIDDVNSWFKFGRICWLLGFPCEYLDNLSKRSLQKSDCENNLKYYKS